MVVDEHCQVRSHAIMCSCWPQRALPPHRRLLRLLLLLQRWTTCVIQVRLLCLRERMRQSTRCHRRSALQMLPMQLLISLLLLLLMLSLPPRAATVSPAWSSASSRITTAASTSSIMTSSCPRRSHRPQIQVTWCFCVLGLTLFMFVRESNRRFSHATLLAMRF
jgi:hypothetical protein